MQNYSVKVLLLVTSTALTTLAQTFTTAPSVAMNANGTLEIFARGSDGACWHNWQSSPGGSWVGWNSLGGGIVGAPAVISNADGRLEVFVLGGGNAVYHNWQTAPQGGWSGWQLLGGSISSPPKVAANFDGRLTVFARGVDGAGWYISQLSPGGGWSSWAFLGGWIVDSPSVELNTDGRLEVFALGGGQTAFHNWQVAPGGAWSGWSSLSGGGGISTTPTVGKNHDGRLEIFERGTDQAPWHAYQPSPGGNFTGWSSFGGAVTSSPAVVLNGEGGLEIFANGGTAAYHNWQVSAGGNWFGWQPLGGSLSAPPVAAMNFDGRVEIFGLWQDGTIWHDWMVQAGGGWSGWQPLSQASNGGTTNISDLGYLWTDVQNSANYSAAKNSCSPPPWWTAANAWPCGSRVNISIIGYKDQKPFRKAIANWNSALLGYPGWAGGVPVQLNISSGGPQSVHVYKFGNKSILGSGGPNDYSRAQNTNQQTNAQGRLMSLDIQIISGMAYGPTLTTTFAHELGHTFGLFDCNKCSTNGHPFNVMDTHEQIPLGHQWGDYVSMNYGEGSLAPQLVISRSLLLTSPTMLLAFRRVRRRRISRPAQMAQPPAFRMWAKQQLYLRRLAVYWLQFFLQQLRSKPLSGFWRFWRRLGRNGWLRPSGYCVRQFPCRLCKWKLDLPGRLCRMSFAGAAALLPRSLQRLSARWLGVHR